MNCDKGSVFPNLHALTFYVYALRWDGRTVEVCCSVVRCVIVGSLVWLKLEQNNRACLKRDPEIQMHLFILCIEVQQNRLHFTMGSVFWILT